MVTSLDEARRRRHSEESAGGRVPPHDLAAEEALLGAMLLDRDAIDAATERLTASDFYKPSHGHIFDAAVTLHSHSQPVDTVTVTDQLRRADLLDTIGGAATLTGLMADTPATRSAGRYATIVAECAQLRTMIGAAGEIAEMGYSMPDDIPATIDRAEQIIYDIADRSRNSHAVHLGDSLGSYIDRLNELSQTGNTMRGVATGWLDLDDRLGGLRPGQLIIVAGRPGMGKSAFLGNLATNTADSGARTLLVSAEMAIDELQDRFVASEARVDLTRIRNGRLLDSDWPKLSHAVNRFTNLPIWIHEAASATLLSVRAEARRVANRAGSIDLIIVDYLQLLKGVGRFENRQTEVAVIARGLKELALDLRVPVVAAAQLNRGLEIRAEKRPALADLRESGELENSADVVIFLYRDDYYNPQSDDRGTCEVHVAKHRNGPTGITTLAWLDHYGRFANMARV